MTYHREYDDPRFQRGGFGEYPSNLDAGRGSSKWTLLAAAAIFAVLGTFILFPREATVSNEGTVESLSQPKETTPEVGVSN